MKLKPSNIMTPFAMLAAVMSSLMLPSMVFAQKPVSFSSVVEVEAAYSNPESGGSESDIAVATVKVGMVAEINEQLSAKIVLLYEEDDTDLEVDVAQLMYAFDSSPLSLIAGQLYVPFGNYKTNLLSDPLTLELGETRESTIMLSYENDALSGSFYIFNGDNNKGADSIDNWGASFGYSNEMLSLSIGYINDLGDSDALQDSLFNNDVTSYADGITASAVLGLESVTVIVEYTSALDAFDMNVFGGTEPAATNLEVDYAMTVAGKPAVLAFAYQTSDESLLLELPEKRFLIGLGVELNEDFAIGFEYSKDEDYGESEGGTGESVDNIVLQLAVEF